MKKENSIKLYYCTNCKNYFTEKSYKDINYNYRHDLIDDAWDTIEDVECCPCCDNHEIDFSEETYKDYEVADIINEYNDIYKEYKRLQETNEFLKKEVDKFIKLNQELGERCAEESSWKDIYKKRIEIKQEKYEFLYERYNELNEKLREEIHKNKERVK